MTTQQWLRVATNRLQTEGISTPRLDALIVLEDVLGLYRAQLLAEPYLKIAPSKLARLEKLLKRRSQHVPLAYIRGKAEFYGREFIVTPVVLVPRPESEVMIDILKSLVDSGSLTATAHRPLCLADVGAGSGSLGIMAALEVPYCQVELLEIDTAAAQVAKDNVDKFTLQIPVVQSNLVSNATLNYDILLCNLPYVPDDYKLNRAATHEPRLAIFGGLDGLNLYRQLFTQLQQQSNMPLFLLLESFPSQHAKLQSIAAHAGYKIVTTNDFIQAYKRIL